MTAAAKLWRDCRGVIAVEFAMLITLILMLSIGVMELGMMMLTDASLEMAIRAASRTGMIATDVTDAQRNAKIQTIVERVMGNWIGSRGVLTIDKTVYPNLDAIGRPTWVDSDGDGGCAADGSEGVCPNRGGVQVYPGLGTAGSLVLYRLTLERPGYTGIMNLVGISRLTFSRQAIVLNE